MSQEVPVKKKRPRVSWGDQVLRGGIMRVVTRLHGKNFMLAIPSRISLDCDENR